MRDYLQARPKTNGNRRVVGTTGCTETLHDCRKIGVLPSVDMSDLTGQSNYQELITACVQDVAGSYSGSYLAKSPDAHAGGAGPERAHDCGQGVHACVRGYACARCLLLCARAGDAHHARDYGYA